MSELNRRVVLDTNLWISALLFGGLPAQLIKLAQDGHVEIYTSQDLLAELADVLGYPKFQSRLKRLSSTSEALLINVTRLATICESPPPLAVPELRDQDDMIVLQAAVAAQAIAIVSGDDDLLALEQIGEISILTVRAFLFRYFPDSS